jgi:hypothetical protein
MKHNEWFEGKFLASLKNGQWITEKQVAICKRYMVASRYSARKYLLASGNVKYTVDESAKGYGRFYREEFPMDIEANVTDRFGNQFSAY